MKKFLKERKLNIICSVAAVAFIWVCWIIAYYAVGNDYIIPSFQDTFLSLFKCFCEGGFWAAFGLTLLRTLAAFLISFLLAAALAAGSALSKVFKSTVKPFMTALRALPTLAVILIFLIWTSAAVAPVIVTVLLLLPMIYARINAAIDNVDGEILEMARLYGVTRKDRLFKIYLPQISPEIFALTGSDISLGLKVMISAEVLSNTYLSLGGLMQSARSFLEMPRLAALTLVAVLSGLVAEVCFSQLKRINRKWLKAAEND